MKSKLPLFLSVLLFGFSLLNAPSRASASSIEFTSPLEDRDPAAFSDIRGVGALNQVSAVLNAGSMMFFGERSAGGDVGGEWAYASGLLDVPGGVTEGISSAGFELLGSPNFGGPSLYGSTAVNGRNYGTTPVGDNTRAGNTAVAGSEPLTKNSVVFTWSGLPDDFGPGIAGVSRVSFQYGAGLTDVNVPASEPATMLLMGAGLIGLAFFGGRKLLKR